MIKRVVGTALFLGMFVLPSLLFAKQGKIGKAGIGINYPGLSLKWNVEDFITAEVKAQFEKDISTTGARIYYNYEVELPSENAPGGRAFVGVDFGGISFKSEKLKGSGSYIGFFIGAEVLSILNFGIGVDIGPVWIHLEEELNKSEKDFYEVRTEEGLDFVLNLSLTYYFGGDK